MTRTILFVALALLAGCESVSEAQPPTAPPAIEVAITAAAEADVSRTLTLTGTLAAREDSAVAADVTGRVVSTHVERGELVEAGAVLARVDVEAAAVGAAEARAQLESTRADDAQARLECRRSELLWERRAITDRERDRDRSRCEASSWAVRAAEARLARAQLGVGDGVVRAPFRGIVAERAISPGEYVRPDTRVALLLDTSTLRLELTVPEADTLAIVEGQLVRFTVAALPGATFEGRVQYVGPALRRDSRDLTVEALVDNAAGQLRPGMFAVSEIDLGAAPQLTVPRTALRDVDGTSRVFVANNDHVEERVVRIGPAVGESIVILEGLAAGDRVVDAPSEALSDGTLITVH